MDKPVTLEKALDTVELIDCLSQCGFDKIKAIADVAIIGMNSGSFTGGMRMYATLFEAIAAIADETMNCINVEAECVGANYSEVRERKRVLANCQNGGAA